jgi:putative transposase
MTLSVAPRESLGSRTLMRNLRLACFEVGSEKVRRLMKSMGFRVKQKRKDKSTTDSKHRLPVAKNVLDRQFSPAAPNQVLGTNIIYLWPQEGLVVYGCDYRQLWPTYQSLTMPDSSRPNRIR